MLPTGWQEGDRTRVAAATIALAVIFLCTLTLTRVPTISWNSPVAIDHVPF